MVNRVDRIDGLTGSIAVKAPVKVATSAAIILTGAQTISGIVLTADATPRERVLVKDQPSDTENGIYDVNSGAWTRSPDFDGARDAADGTQVLVNEGASSFARSYYLSATNPVDIGTDPLTFIFVEPTETAFAEPDFNEIDQGVTGNGNTIKVAVDAIGAEQGTILLRHNSGSATTTYTLTTSETIPSNITLERENGAIITGAGTLTLNGTLVGPDSQWLTTTITLEGSPKIDNVSPFWFGSVGDGVTDDTDTLNVAEDFATSSMVPLNIPSGKTFLTDRLTIECDLIGFGALKATASATGAVILTGASGLTIQDVSVDGSGVTIPIYVFTDHADCKVINTRVSNAFGAGIRFETGADDGIATGNYIKSSTGSFADGIYVGGAERVLISNNNVYDYTRHGIVFTGAAMKDGSATGNIVKFSNSPPGTSSGLWAEA